MASRSRGSSDIDGKYQKLTPENEHELSNLQDPVSPVASTTSTRRPKVWWLSEILLQLVAFAWLVPAFALLVLNLRTTVIGATAWCPSRKCWVDANDERSSVPLSNIAHFDKNNHNLIGFLQLVSKALEVWFSAIAISLMWLATMRLATSRGVPIRFVALPYEFTDVCSLFDLSIWRSLPSLPLRLTSGGSIYRGRLWTLAFFGAFLCVLCNLMGPGIAVLIIPTLQWLKTRRVGDGWFTGFNHDRPPLASVDAWAFSDSGCSENAFKAMNYSCSANIWGTNIDAWFQGSVASAAQVGDGSYVSRTTVQDNILSYLNITSIRSNDGTEESRLIWVPNRQVLSQLNSDARVINGISVGLNATSLNVDPSEYESYLGYNKSLELQLQRTGPILGTYPNNFTTRGSIGWWTTAVGVDRSILCFEQYALAYPIDHFVNNFTKCVQQGSGWGGNVKNNSFQITKRNTNGASINPVDITVISSDRAVFLPYDELPSNAGSPHFDRRCIGSYDVEILPPELSCDWDLFWGKSFNEYSTSNASDFVTTIRMYQQAGTTSYDYFGMVIDFVTYQGFTMYTLDPQLVSNPMWLVQTPSLPVNGTTIPLDPAWIFAAWSVDYNNGFLPTYRPSAELLVHAMDHWRTGGKATVVDFATTQAALFIPLLQTLSLIDYTPLSEGPPSEADELIRTARLYVWAYSMSSRTAYLGCAVVILGICVALVQIALGIVDRRPTKSLSQLLVAALAHVPNNEFDGCSDTESKAESVRFRLREREQCPGQVKFDVRS